jgi:hypothetical protein
LTVGIENIELTVVLAKGGSGVGGAGVAGGTIQTLAFSHDHCSDDAQQAVTIVCEILQHLDRATPIPQHSDQVWRLDLCTDEGLGRVQRTNLLAFTHSGHVEVKGQEATVFIANLAAGLRRNMRLAQLVKNMDVFRLRSNGRG